MFVVFIKPLFIKQITIVTYKVINYKFIVVQTKRLILLKFKCLVKTIIVFFILVTFELYHYAWNCPCDFNRYSTAPSKVLIKKQLSLEMHCVEADNIFLTERCVLYNFVYTHPEDR